MNNYLLIGVGGTGSNAVDLLYQKMKELGNLAGSRIKAVVFDTDKAAADRIEQATVIPLAAYETLGTVVDRLGSEMLEDWFPCHRGEEARKRGLPDGEGYRGQELYKGAAQWRKKSYLSFLYLMQDETRRTRFLRVLDELVGQVGPGDSVEIYTVASLAGGTGSGSFIPITLYVKKYLKEKYNVEARSNAMLACPDIYHESVPTNDQRTKIYANAYAIMRELNAMNLVANGYNRVQGTDGNHAPVRFKLGYNGGVNNPVGLLFDAADERFWNPTCVPFNSIYLFDKIAGLHSPELHDAVMANSLYAILCTGAGLNFDSQASNDETFRSSMGNENAVYAGIASSEIRYPLESVVRYIAHREVESASEGEWTYLYRTTQDGIEESRRQAEEMRAPFILKDGEYAERMLKAYDNELQDGITNISSIVRRNTTDVLTGKGSGGEQQVKEIPILDRYFAGLVKELSGGMECAAANAFAEAHKNFPTTQAPGFFASSSTKTAAWEELAQEVQGLYGNILGYYQNAISVIQNGATSKANAILPLDERISPVGNPNLSFVSNILTRNGLHIHPVSAMIQLCSFRTKIAERIRSVTPWEELKRRETVYRLSSAYSGEEYEQIVAVGSGDEEALRTLIASKANFRAKTEEWKESISSLYETICKDANEQFVYAVLSTVLKRVDLLIEQYKRFFASFEKEREVLHDMTVAALKDRSETVGNTIYVGASVQEKEAAYEAYRKKGGGESAEDLAAAEDGAGRPVFEIAYAGAIAAQANSGKAVKENAGESKKRMTGFFDGMVESYVKRIQHSEFYQEQAEKSIFSVLVERAEAENGGDSVMRGITPVLMAASEKAQPGLKLKTNHPVMLSVMVATAAAEDLKKMSSRLKLPEAGQLGALVSQFLAQAGVVRSSVSVAPDLSDKCLYFTKKLDNIQPVDVDKLDELGNNPVYYRYYEQAIRNITALGTDMWNPHLGLSLHKRGYLPYINSEYEAQCDRELVKALLYCLMAGKITFKPLPRSSNNVFWVLEGGSLQMMVDADRQLIDENHLASLLDWLRMRDDLVAAWAGEYDRMVKDACAALPTLQAAGSTQELERKITTSPIVKMLRENLFVNVNGSDTAGGLSLSLLEFAFKVKGNEEASRDRDDAEKILKVGFDTLVTICRQPVGLGKDTEFAQVYLWQLYKFADALMGDEDVVKMGKNGFEYVQRLFNWANEHGCFYDLDPLNHPLSFTVKRPADPVVDEGTVTE